MTTHDCPGGCGTQVPHHHLGCKPCWFRLPRRLRDAMTATYLQRHVDAEPYWQAMDAALQWYQNNPRKDVQTA